MFVYDRLAKTFGWRLRVKQYAGIFHGVADMNNTSVVRNSRERFLQSFAEVIVHRAAVVGKIVSFKEAEKQEIYRQHRAEQRLPSAAQPVETARGEQDQREKQDVYPIDVYFDQQSQQQGGQKVRKNQHVLRLFLGLR